MTAYRYLVAEVLRVMLMSLLLISLLGSIVLAYQLARSGIRLGFLWPVLIKSLAYPLFFSMPVSFLFGITLGIGRLTADREINALRASGLSYFQLALPPTTLALLLTTASLYLNGEVIPEIHYQKGNLRDAILAQLEDLGSGTNRSLLLPRGGRLFVESYSGTRLRGVHLEVNETIGRRLSKDLRRTLRDATSRGGKSRRGPRVRPTLLARECDLEISSDRTRILLNLRGVKVHIPQAVTGADRRPDVFRQTISIANFKLALPFLPRGERVKDRSWKELLKRRREIVGQTMETKKELVSRRSALALWAPPAGDMEISRRDRTTRHARLRALEGEVDYLQRRGYGVTTEFHRRIAFSLACLSFCLVGVPLIFLAGMKGRLVVFFLGNVFVALPFFLLVMLGIKLGETGVAPAVTLGVPNVLLIGAAVFLWSKLLRK